MAARPLAAASAARRSAAAASPAAGNRGPEVLLLLLLGRAVAVVVVVVVWVRRGGRGDLTHAAAIVVRPINVATAVLAIVPPSLSDAFRQSPEALRHVPVASRPRRLQSRQTVRCAPLMERQRICRRIAINTINAAAVVDVVVVVVVVAVGVLREERRQGLIAPPASEVQGRVPAAIAEPAAAAATAAGRRRDVGAGHGGDGGVGAHGEQHACHGAVPVAHGRQQCCVPAAAVRRAPVDVRAHVQQTRDLLRRASLHTHI